jgi:hypothetical protein
MYDVCILSAEPTSAVGIPKERDWFTSAGEDDRAIGGEKLAGGFGWIGNFVRRK